MHAEMLSSRAKPREASYASNKILMFAVRSVRHGPKRIRSFSQVAKCSIHVHVVGQVRKSFSLIGFNLDRILLYWDLL